MRRLFALVTVLLMLPSMSALATGHAASPLGTFTDDNNSIHEADIEAIAAEGITLGCNPPTNDHYCPDDPVTRAQMATFLTRALELTPVAPTPPSGRFTDDDSSIHEADIEAIAAEGITLGCNPPTNDRFCPNDPVTRAQMATFLTRALELTPVAPTPPSGRFTDDDSSIHEADIEAIAAEGITLGCNPPTNDHYCPDDPVTRAQMASLLTRALGLMPLPPPAVGSANLTRLYYFAPTADGEGPFLATVARYTTAAPSPDGALELLLAGPNAAELTDQFSSNIPEGVTSNEPVTVAGGTATVDLSSEFDDGGGSFTMIGRLAELTFTMTALPSIDRVALELDDVPVDVFSSEGLVIPPTGLDRAYFLPSDTDVLGLGVTGDVFPEAPAHGEVVESPIEMRGLSRSFEATVSWELTSSDGAVTESGFATTGGATGEMLPMEIDIPYTSTAVRPATVSAWWDSPKDGAEIDRRDVAVWLTP